MFRLLMICLFSLSLMACTSLKTASELQQGKRYYDAGFYKRSMHVLLPLAADGNAEAQYAVGYMYYYGFGVAQDTDTGEFWINRAAKQHYEPAINALQTVEKEDALERHDAQERKEMAEKERMQSKNQEITKRNSYPRKIRFSDIKNMD